MLKSQENPSERVLLGTNAAQLENIFIKRAVSQLFSCIFNAGLWKYYKEVCKSLIRFNFYKFAKEFINWNFFWFSYLHALCTTSKPKWFSEMLFRANRIDHIPYIFNARSQHDRWKELGLCKGLIKIHIQGNSTSWLARGNTW